MAVSDRPAPGACSASTSGRGASASPSRTRPARSRRRTPCSRAAAITPPTTRAIVDGRARGRRRDTIVVGLPLSLSGGTGPAARAALRRGRGAARARGPDDRGRRRTTSGSRRSPPIAALGEARIGRADRRQARRQGRRRGDAAVVAGERGTMTQVPDDPDGSPTLDRRHRRRVLGRGRSCSWSCRCSSSAAARCGSGGSSTRPAGRARGRRCRSTTAGASRASATSSSHRGVIGSSLRVQRLLAPQRRHGLPGRHLRAAQEHGRAATRSTALEGRARTSTTPSCTVPPGLWLQADRAPGRRSCRAATVDAFLAGARRTTRCGRRSSPPGVNNLEGLLWPDTYKHLGRQTTRSTSCRRWSATFDKHADAARPRERQRRRATRRTTSSRSRR